MPERVYVPQRHLVDNIAGCARDVYDFEAHGGLQTVISLPLEIPANAIVTQVIIDPLVPIVGAANIELGLVSSDGLVGAADNLLASTAGPSITAPTLAKTATDLFKLPAKTGLQLTISGADITAGKFAVYIGWVGSYDDITPNTVT